MSYHITVLIENTVLPGQSLLAEHGLSFFVELPDIRYLQDRG